MNAIHFYIGLAVTNLVVLAGWVFAIKQNEASLRRERRVDAFAQAYDILIRVGVDGGIPARRQINGVVDDYSCDLEWAIATVHLYGTDDEVELLTRQLNRYVMRQVGERGSQEESGGQEESGSQVFHCARCFSRFAR
jgi:hypothetical protein